MKAVILAGGTGTRLWPLSRQKKPKQFQKLVSNRTLFQEAVARLNFLNPKDIYVALNQENLAEVRRQAPKIPRRNLIVEPALRDTASCIGLAAVHLHQKFPDETMAVIYADHLIQNTKEFQQKLKIAAKLAQAKNTLNIIEVKAKFPNVHLGYVKIGKMLTEKNNVKIYSFKKFVEKPNLKTAQKFAKDFHYLWNTGYYVWRIDQILKQYQKYLPQTYRRLKTIQRSLGTKQEKTVIAREYPKLQKISIDYAIMEKVDPKLVRIIPADLGWSDIGSFEALHNELTQNPKDNLVKGKFIGLENQNNLIYNFGPQTIAGLGLKNLTIINTPDAILICPKNRGQEIKKLVEKMREQNPRLL